MSGGLPKNWLTVGLSQVIVFSKGKKPNILLKEMQESFVPYVDIKAFEKGIIDEYADIQSSKLIDQNDVLVVWDGARCGLPGIGLAGAACSTLMVLKPVLSNPRFLYHFLMYCYKFINSKPKGTGTPHVNPDVFWSLPFPIVPLNEQKRIVAKLVSIMPRIDSVKERLEKIPAILKRFRQSVLTAAVTGKLTEKWREEHPEVGEWKEIQSRELFLFVTSGSRGWAKYYSEKGPLFLRIGNLDHNSIELDLTNKQFVTPPENAEGVRTKVQTNDILISITADVGMIALVPCNLGEAYINQHISLARPNSIANPVYLAWFLASPEGQTQFLSLQKGATKVGLGLDDIKNVIVPLPPLDEQKEIVRQVDKLFALADKVEEHYQKARARMEALAQSVLAKAFRGELVPQDPDDEPAENLLQRIREEKAKMETELKTVSRRARETRKNGAKTQRAGAEEKQAREP